MVNVELEWNWRAADSRKDFIILFVDNCSERVICESICEQRTFATKYYFDYSVDLRCEQYRFCCPNSYLVVDGDVHDDDGVFSVFFPISCNRTYGTCVTCAYSWNFRGQNIWSHTHVPRDDSLMEKTERRTRRSNIIIDRLADSVPFNTIYTYFAKCELIDLEWMIHTNDDGMEPSWVADESGRWRADAHTKSPNRLKVSNIATNSCAFFCELVSAGVSWCEYWTIIIGRLGRMWCIAHTYFVLPIFRLVPSIYPCDATHQRDNAVSGHQRFHCNRRNANVKNAKNDAKLYGKNIFRPN